MSWTDDRVDHLLLLNAKGLSASQIASEIGGISRNAVIGKLSRLGIGMASGRVVRGPEEAKARRLSLQQKRRENQPRIQSIRARLKVSPETILEFSQDDVAQLTPEQKAAAVTFLDLQPHQCKWPYGDPRSPDFVYCGHDREEDGPYCATHAAIACNKPTKTDTFKPIGEAAAAVVDQLRKRTWGYAR